MNEAQRQEWNAAVARGDEAEMDRIADEVLSEIAERQLADWDVHRRTR